MVLWSFVQELSKAQPAVVLVLKRLRSLNSRPAGNRTCDPWFTRHRFIPYTTAASHTRDKIIIGLDLLIIYYDLIYRHYLKKKWLL